MDRGPSLDTIPVYLVVKQECKDSAREIFADMDVHITTSHGKRHLGAALGSKSFTDKYMNIKVQGWTKDIMNLAEVALSQPHAAYAAYVHGLSSYWSYLQRTVSDMDDLLLLLENATSQPHAVYAAYVRGLSSCWSYLQRAVSDIDDLLLPLENALPTRFGGLGIYDPSATSSECFLSSECITRNTCSIHNFSG